MQTTTTTTTTKITKGTKRRRDKDKHRKLHPATTTQQHTKRQIQGTNPEPQAHKTTTHQHNNKMQQHSET